MGEDCFICGCPLTEEDAMHGDLCENCAFDEFDDLEEELEDNCE